jgi:serine protease
MKLKLFGAALFLTAFAASPAARAQDTIDEDVPFGTLDQPAPTQLLIDLRDDTTDDDEHVVENELGGIDIHLNSVYSTHDRIFIADVDPSMIDEFVRTLANDPRVEVAEPNYLYEMTAFPNDPLYAKQWSFPMIDAPAAWKDGATGKGVVVAVIDTGVAYENYEKFKQVEDLGGAEFVKGYDFVNDDDHPNDDHGHGTHVAGTIAQRTNNGKGVAGVAYEAKIMPLKVLNKNGMGTAADIADAIRYAADEGAQVINMSLGGGGRSMAMESAVAYARKKNVVVVCAAGNGSRNRVEFPAAYPGAFAVSAVGPDKKLAFYSSYGKELAISAPGGDKQKGGEAGAILQNTITPNDVGKTDAYLAFQGTSMATPHVAGVAALVISAGVTDAGKVEAILKDTAEDVGEKGWDEKYGAGIVNAGKAVKAAHETTGGWKHLIAGLGTLLLFVAGFKRKFPGGAKLGLGALLGTVLASAGLFFLNRLGLGGIPGVSLLSTPMPEWDGELLGSAYRFTAIWASFIPVLIATVGLLSAKKIRGFLMGVALGWAAHLLVMGVSSTEDVRFIPGIAGALDSIWLFVSAGVLLMLAALIARVASIKK